MYSQERASDADLAELSKVVRNTPDNVPFFALVRRQQLALERAETHLREVQSSANFQRSCRRRIAEVVDRWQQRQLPDILFWVFGFWVATFVSRKNRMHKCANALENDRAHVVRPFVLWRLHVSQRKVNRASRKCQAVASEASSVAKMITDLEIKREGEQGHHQASLDSNADLNILLVAEEQEKTRIQSVWDESKPELMLAAFVVTLKHLFTLFVDVSRFWSLAVLQRLACKDVTPLMKPLEENASLEALLVPWVNTLLSRSRDAAIRLLVSSGTEARSCLQMASQTNDIRGLDGELQDGRVLGVIVAALRAARDGRDIICQDYRILGERDEIRAAHFCSVLPTLSLDSRRPCALTVNDILSGNPRAAASALASVFLKHPMLPDVDARQTPERLICKMFLSMDRAFCEPADDPSLLLAPGEDFNALIAISAECLLLRWVNVQLLSDDHRPVENFGSDFQDGSALTKLLTVIAPNFLPQIMPESFEDRLECVLAAATRCVGVELLTASAIVESQADVLAAFLAELFLARPTLAARPGSLMLMRLELLETVCSESSELLADVCQNDAQVIAFCTRLEPLWPEVMIAMQTVQDAKRNMSGILDRMQTFVGETLAQRARGHPRVMLDAKEAREIVSYTNVNMDRLRGITSMVVRGAIEDVVRKHFKLLRDIFLHYSGCSAGSSGVTLEGVLKLYQDCKMRSRDFAPQHLEAIFYQHLDSTHSERALSAQTLIEVLLRCAHQRFRHVVDDLVDQFEYLVEDYLKPYACQESGGAFPGMSYDPQVREVLGKYKEELKKVFQVYAKADMSTVDAQQKVDTMNISEFHLLLVHCKVLDDMLTESAVQEIFEGIQQSANGDESEDEVLGLDDDSELAFSEFLDGLVAVTAFKFPDPFTSFSARVNATVLALFSALRRHWSGKRVSVEVEDMVHALQRKLK